ncbi:MAG: putative dehydrogenase/threonine dehydrogenase-like Zn-dependent dehydrogenase [Alteromonas naphthalenivorans]|jgi:predicted dehydrogenase/threonine dehydrogenase-like Zn-dependent dehydrogenase
MRQVFLENGKLIVQKVAQPHLDENALLVSVHYSFISSGTEAATIANASQNPLFSNVPQKIKAVLKSLATHGVEGTRALVESRLKGTLQALGYSCSGKVIAVGKKVTQFRPGDYVACAGAGWANHADIVCIPENLAVIVPKKEAVRNASITTIGSIALQGIRRAQVQLGEIVCVVGLGLLGQITVQLAKNAGATVIGVDLVQDRLDTAKELGADYVYKGGEGLNKELDFLTKHHGVDCTIITAATASDEVVQQAMEITRRKGKVVVVGDVGLNLQRNPMYKKEIDFLISCSYGPGRYDKSYEIDSKDYPYDYVRWTENRNMQAIAQLIAQNKLTIDKLITHEFHIDDVAQAYDLIKEKKALGVIIRYTPKEDDSFIPAVRKPFDQKDIKFLPTIKDTVRVGFVGVGGFAQVKLLPMVKKIPGVKISAIVDANVTAAENTSRTYGAATALVDSQELFDKDLVDVVVIASPHKFHSDQVIGALSHGKAVFVEKPMVTTFEQHKQLSEFLANNPKAPFCVDYNRSFAPFIQKIKWEVSERKTPLVIQYRMNAGYITADHWVQTDVGAGRIIGEACHIFDLFCFLTGANPTAVSVEALKPQGSNLFPTDNFSAQISFDDGSICSLLYTAIGHAGLGKERMEVFFDSKSIVMDDYKVLKGFGTSPGFNESVQMQDKGHEVLMHKFFASLKEEKRTMPIDLKRLNMVSKLTLTIDDLACRGGGIKEVVVE